MRMIKAFAAIAALMFVAACSSEQAAAPAGTTVAPGSVADFRQNVGDRVYFDTDASTVREDGRGTLTKQAAWLKQYATYQITVEGHCDERGTREYNIALGERRHRGPPVPDCPGCPRGTSEDDQLRQGAP